MLPNNLRLTNLTKLGNIKKSQNFIELIARAQSFFWNESFVTTSEQDTVASVSLFIICFLLLFSFFFLLLFEYQKNYS